MQEIKHDIYLRDIRGGELVVSYRHIAEGRTYTAHRDTSSRLPLECLTLFDDGVVNVCDLTEEERQWLQAESTARSNAIDFEGVDV